MAGEGGERALGGCKRVGLPHLEAHGGYVKSSIGRLGMTRARTYNREAQTGAKVVKVG